MKRPDLIAFALVSFASLLGGMGCDESVSAKADAGPSRLDGGDAGPDFASALTLRVPVGATGRTFVKLDPPSVVAPADAEGSADKWDLAFEGFDAFTNSGVSGKGKGAVFGPLDSLVFAFDEAPFVPFLTQDRTGGAFVDWYKYDGSGSTPVLWSRFHVFGVRDGATLYKVQIVSYYGERAGAPVAALYKIRYADVTAGGPIKELDLLDGTAGGPAAPASAPSECVDLGSGARVMLTPENARQSSAWHLCFRRQVVTVNGGIGGPRNITAVDLDAAQVATETVDAVKIKTPEGEAARFSSITASSFDGLPFRGDRIVSGFGDLWIEHRDQTPKPFAWLVVDASGKQKFLVGFERFEGVTATSPGTIVLRMKRVSG
jgi:hypothetical protein